jgi:hypothetical protein
MYRLILQQRVNQVNYEYNRRNPTKPLHGLTAGMQTEMVANGPNGLILRNQIAAMPDFAPPVVPQPPPQCPLEEQFQYALGALFSYNASISLPPTRCSRIYYLFFFGVATAYSYVTTSAKISGTKDSWDWTAQKGVALDDQGLYVWMTRAFIELLPSFVSGSAAAAATSGFLSRERDTFGWTEEQQVAAAAAAQARGGWSAWLAAWQSWLTARGSDGNVAAATVPPDSALPNGATVLDVTTTQNFADKAAYPNPSGWTPLRVGGTKRNYLTYGWGDVISTCLSAGDEAAIKVAAQEEFLSGGSTERTTEIEALKGVVTTLTDEQKIIAEFWEGGPNTVAPPGMAVWMWSKFCRLTGQGIEKMVYSALDLAIHLFESSRLTWALKKDNMESRPIQEIRRRYAGQQLASYTGTSVAAALWMPYQASNFVTPPFPDFPSGHSTFSQSLANVMEDWFGDALPPTEFACSDLLLISPLFKAVSEKTVSLQRFVIDTGTSRIQLGVVPAAPVTLTFSTWQDMAEQAGISRQYGGIHAQSAHLGGQAVANGLHTAIKAAWSITH